MEVGNGQPQATFPRTFECDDMEDEDDDDDGHFVIALDDSDADNNKLDEFDGHGSEDTQQLKCGENVDVIPTKTDQVNGSFDTSLAGERYSANEDNDENATTMRVWQSKVSSAEPLHLEFTVEDDGVEHSSHLLKDVQDKPVLDTGQLKECPKIPDFLLSSPEIIKRLKSSLIDPSVVSQKVSNHLSCPKSPVASGHGDQGRASDHVLNSLRNSLNAEKDREAKRKLKFTPRNDCTCVMCHGWSASQFCSKISSENCTSTNRTVEALQSSHNHHRSEKNGGKLLRTSNSEQRLKRVGSTFSTQNVTLTSNVSNHPSVSNIHPSSHHSISFSVGEKTRPSHLSRSLLTASKVTGAEKVKNNHLKSMTREVNAAKSSRIKRMLDDCSPHAKQPPVPVLSSNGSYFLVLPHSNAPTSSSNAQASSARTSTVTRVIPEIKTNEGKTLLLTRDFITSYQPDLRYALKKASKVDLSKPDRVSVTLSEDASGNASKKLSSHTRLLIQKAGSAHSTLCNIAKDNVSSAPSTVSEDVGDVLFKMINSHLKVSPLKKPVSAENAGENMDSSVPFKLQSLMSQSAPRILKTGASDIIHPPGLAAFSDGKQRHAVISQSQQILLSSLPPPPPLVRCPTAPRQDRVIPSISRRNDFGVAAEEPTETLIIPLQSLNSCKDPPINTPNQNTSVQNVDGHMDWSSDLYTFSVPMDSSPVKMESKEENEHVSKGYTSPLQKKEQESTGVGLSSILIGVKPKNSHSDSNLSLVYEVTTSKVSQSVPHFDQLLSHKSNANCLRQAPHDSPLFPAVVKVNLSSCSNFTYPSTTVTPSNNYLDTPSSKPLPRVILSSSRDSSVTSVNCFTTAASSHQEQVVMVAPMPISYQKSISSKTIGSSSSSVPLTVKQSFQENNSEAYSSLTNFIPHTSINTNCLGLVSHTRPICSPSQNTCFTTTKSSPALVPSTRTLQTSKASLPSTSLPPSSTLSSSSVSVNGLKLKIRLGEAKTKIQVVDADLVKSRESVKTPEVGIMPNVDLLSGTNQSDLVVKDPSAERVETAEEMFHRFQEQAMQQVYNAQFGVGDLARSLRPSRSNIAFVDKFMPDKKKKPTEENKDKRKPSEESKITHTHISALPTMPIGTENEKELWKKTSKKRHSSIESRCDIPRKEPKTDINSYHKLRQDNSILIRKTIFTPNIMAGHKVFVKFNVFSNVQSGSSFLAPFFNLGGSRVQFDNEDMEYIKKSVSEVEKEEKFCARHLLYYSRECKKATFLRKENIAQTSELNDKSYKKCSYILEGFSREPAKRKSVPIPEEWKVDKKVSIEIDTAEVDNNIVIDFENSLDTAVSYRENDTADSNINVDDSKGHVAIKETYCVTDSNPNASISKVKLNAVDICTGETCEQFECKEVDRNTDTCSLPNVQIKNQRDNVSDMSIFRNSVRSVQTKSSIFRPNILQKIKKPAVPISRTSSSSSLINPLCNISPEASLEQSSPVSETSYTDQLKELFASGILQKTVLPVGLSPCSEEFDKHSNSNNGGEQLVKRSLDVVKDTGSNPHLDISIKKEIMDKEYEQSDPPSLATYNKSPSTKSKKSGDESLANVRIKPEPIDEYFDSFERRNETNSMVPLLEGKSETNSMVPPLERRNEPNSMVPLLEGKSETNSMVPPLERRNEPNSMVPLLEGKSETNSMMPPLERRNEPNSMVIPLETRSETNSMVPPLERTETNSIVRHNKENIDEGVDIVSAAKDQIVPYVPSNSSEINAPLNFEVNQSSNILEGNATAVSSNALQSDREIDEETLSAQSNSPLPSSSVSESSEITSSSCVDTSDEDESDEDENETDSNSNLSSASALSTTITSFTNMASGSPELSNGNLPPNFVNTKITSLVESLKQRLNENSPALPSVFTEPVKQPKVQMKIKKTEKMRTLSEEPIPTEPNGVIKTSTFPDAIVSPPISQDQKSVPNNNAPNATDETFSPPSSELSSVADSPSVAPCLTPSSSSLCGSENSSKVSLNPVPVIPAVPTHQSQEFSATDSNISEFRKRFPFITSSDTAKKSSTENISVSKDTDSIDHPEHSKPSDSVKEANAMDQAEKEKHVQISNHMSQKCATENVDRSVNVANTELIRSTHCSDIDDDIRSNGSDIDVEMESDIDVGTESDIDLGAECVVSRVSSGINASHVKWLLSSPPLPASGRKHLKDFTRENEFLVTKNDPNVQQEVSQTNNVGIIGTSPKKFTLPLRPRTKTSRNKAKPPKAQPAPSVASMLCQKLDISVDPIVPKLKGKLVTPLECSVNAVVVNNQSEPVAPTVSSPKPINPTFKPSINAIFGVVNIPSSVDTLITKCNSSKSKASGSKSNKGQSRKQVAKKGTLKSLRLREKIVQKQQEEATEHNEKDSQETKVTPKAMEDDVIDKKISDNQDQTLSKKVSHAQETIADKKVTGVLDDVTCKKSSSVQDNVPLIDKQMSGVIGDEVSALYRARRYQSLRKFAWRKFSKENKNDMESKDSNCVSETAKSATIMEAVKGDNATKEFEVTPCKVLLYKLEDMDRGLGGGPVKTESGSYFVKDMQEEKKKNRASEITKKRKKKVMIKQKKGKPVRPKRDIVDYYTAAIESLRKKALLLEEDEKKNAMKKEMENQVIIKEEIDDASYATANSPKSTEGIQVQEDEAGEHQCSQLQKSATKDSVMSDSSGKNDVDSVALNEMNRGGNEVISESEGHMTDSADDCCNNGSGNFNSETRNSQLDKVDMEEEARSTNADESNSASFCVSSKGSPPVDSVLKVSNRKSVGVAERNYEGNFIQVLTSLFKDQDDVDEMDDDMMGDSADEDVGGDIKCSEDQEQTKDVRDCRFMEESKGEVKAVTAENDKDATEVDTGWKRETGRPITIVERNYEGEFIQISHKAFQDQLDFEGICDNSDEENKIVSTEIEKDDSVDQSEIILSQKSIEKEIGFGTPIENSEDIDTGGRYVMHGDDERSQGNSDMPHDSLEPLASNETQKTDICSESLQVGDNILTETSVSSSSFVPKDIVLGFEDELGADTVLSKLGPGDADDMFLLGDGDEAEHIGLIPDDEVERLLGLDKCALEQDENKIVDEVGEFDVPKLSWTMVPESVNQNRKDQLIQQENEIERGQSQQSSRAGKDQIEQTRNGGLDVEKAHEVETMEKRESLLSLTISTGVDADDRSMSPDRITVNSDDKTAAISPSWKRILGTQALREIEESVTSAITTASTKQESENIQKSDGNKKPILKTDTFKLKLCTGALSKALKLSAAMRKTFGDSSSEPSSKKEEGGREENSVKLNEREEMPQDKVDEQLDNMKASLAMVNVTRSSAIRNPIERKSKNVREENPVSIALSRGEKEHQSDDAGESAPTEKRTLNSGTVSLHTVNQLETNERENNDNDGLAHRNTDKIKSFNTLNISHTKDSSCMISKVDESPEVNKKPETSTKNTIKAFGSKIDLSKLKLNLKPFLAASKNKLTKNVVKEVENENVPKLVGSSSETKEQNLNCEAKLIGKLGGDDVKVKEIATMQEIVLSNEQSPTSVTSQVKKTALPGLLNKEKLSNMFKNFKKPLNFSFTGGNFSKTVINSSSQLSISKEMEEKNITPENETKVRQRQSPRKRTRSPQKPKAKQNESKRSRVSVTDKKQQESLLMDSSEKNSKVEDKGERSCFDCLSELTPDLWDSK